MVKGPPISAGSLQLICHKKNKPSKWAAVISSESLEKVMFSEAVWPSCAEWVLAGLHIVRDDAPRKGIGIDQYVLHGHSVMMCSNGKAELRPHACNTVAPREANLAGGRQLQCVVRPKKKAMLTRAEKMAASVLTI